MIITKVQDSYDGLPVKLSYEKKSTIGKLIKDKNSQNWYVIHNTIELVGDTPSNIPQYGDYKYGWALYVNNDYISSEYKVELLEPLELIDYEIY